MRGSFLVIVRAILDAGLRTHIAPRFAASQKIAIVQLEYEASLCSLREVQMTMASMKIGRRVWGTLAIAVITALVLGVTLPAGKAAAQSAKDLVDTWTLVSDNNINPDGTRVQPYGPNPPGILMFDAGGRYSIQVMRGGQAKFSSNDRTKGTPKENQATVQNNNPHFGTYTVDEANHVIIFKIEHAMFPNWEGTVQKRPFAITGDELKYTVPSSSLGSGTGEVVWKRAN
jgi:Lipocalin-like domain